MTPIEEKEVLRSFQIVVDSREQDTPRARKRYKSFGVPFLRGVLSYGDYTYTAMLPDGTPINDPSQTLSASAAVERKMNLDELAQCLTRSRERFQREFERARDAGAKVFLLVEDASWENLIAGKYRTKMNSNAFLASLTAWSVRYNITVIFCKAETSGRLIKELLYRDLKERVERGDFG